MSQLNEFKNELAVLLGRFSGREVTPSEISIRGLFRKEENSTPDDSIRDTEVAFQLRCDLSKLTE